MISEFDFALLLQAALGGPAEDADTGQQLCRIRPETTCAASIGFRSTGEQEGFLRRGLKTVES
jgi:hypothetical protein